MRRLTQVDADAVVALGWELLRYHGHLSPWVTPVDSFERFAEAWRPYLDRFIGVDGRLALVAEADEAVVGYLLACVRELPPVFEGPPELVVAEVMVIPERRGGGIGAALMRSAYKWGQRRGCVVVRLNVYDLNDAAIGFYEREGFTTHERVMLRRIINT